MQRARSGTAERPLPTREYLYAAIRNAAIDALRRTRSEQRALGRAAQGADAGASAVISRANTRVVDGCGAGDDAETLDLAAFIQRAIDELPARPREVLLLKWRHGLSNGEVAVELGVALKTVEMHVTRAFARLREILLPLVRGADQR
jgi:RNA polymerase sigma-70 factor (ECF subfamily)